MKTESVGIFYFSGTGNTEIVAELLEREFKRNGVVVERIGIEDVLKGKVQVDIQDKDLIGIGHPVYGFDAPRIVNDFIDLLPSADGKRAFIFKTAGDFASLNNGASKVAIGRLERKGYEVFYDRLICMPSNFGVKYVDELAKQLYDAALVKVEHMCVEILSGKERVRRFGPPAQAAMRLLHGGEELGARLFGKELHVSRTCIDCGRCIDHCPTDNIYRQDGKIKFGWNCLWCMRCIYACPKRAISPRFLEFCVLKGGYDIRSIVNDPNIRGEYITRETEGYFKRFIRYIDQADV